MKELNGGLEVFTKRYYATSSLNLRTTSKSITILQAPKKKFRRQTVDQSQHCGSYDLYFFSCQLILLQRIHYAG